MDSPYTIFANLLFVQRHSTRVHSAETTFCIPKMSRLYRKSLMNRKFLRKTSRPHKNNFGSVYRQARPSNLWAKSTILGSSEPPFSRPYSDFDAPYTLAFFASVRYHLECWEILSEWSRAGREEKVERCSSGICRLLKWRFLLFMSGEGRASSSPNTAVKVSEEMSYAALWEEVIEKKVSLSAVAIDDISTVKVFDVGHAQSDMNMTA